MAKLSDTGFDAFEQVPGQLIGYCTQESFEAGKFNDMLLNENWSVEIIDPQNWNSNWEASFEPVIIKDFCGIRASFHPVDG